VTTFYDRPVRLPVVKNVKQEFPGEPKLAPKFAQLVPVDDDLQRPASAYLPLREGEFRILRLDPGRKEDKVVVCSFVPVSITRPSKYEAISYLWGGNNAKHQGSFDIKVRDPQEKLHLLKIRGNLYAALRNLRHPKDVKLFWVDALCINRSNSAERNKQVAMKRDIFHKAENICFWLGEDASSKAALNFIPQILDLTKIDELVKDNKAIDGWVAFVALLKNTVFSRLWLVQEVAVSRNVTLHCGQPAIHFTDFVDAVAMFVSCRVEIALLFRRHGKNYKQLTDRKITMAERFIDVSTNALRVTSSGEIQRLLTLEALVSQLSDLSTTEPRDRIFSVLALARDGSKLVEETLMEDKMEIEKEGTLRIDYDKSILEVYQDFVIHAISHSRSLNIICQRWASSVSEKEASLPTWIRPLQSSLQPAFDSGISERTDADSLVGIPDHRYYNASRGTSITVPLSLSNNRTSLSVQGFQIDTIFKLGPRASEGIILYEWLELGGCANVGETVPEDFWRTLVADRGPGGSNAPSWYNRAFLYCLHHLTPNGDINTNRLIALCEDSSSLVVDFLQRVQSVIWNRKFLVSKKYSWIGLAPMAAMTEDIVCILYGCSVPVVLRPQKREDEEECFFQLVGECYVHGVMDGGVAEKAMIGGFREELFELR
jgi:hypothetical protein